ncbi:SufE family protein [Candidatus Carsonella ruddii]|uniref:Fe-S metabolism associated domain-containing protein n=1 Tax=Carsonella ruddii TaxID=114186 RepID=A0AAE7KM94_CARRU|nr:SufE family protein [Candidatus Carsonella ruddii]AGS06593.1 hypothetical protein CRDC_00540 [Candidatus Carsonella ruddii DC]ALA96842.1 hypothetical protein AMC76_00580 [Candidatus Carsonella ruddii]QLK14071.1 hypothetical protein FK493_00575 [Candidatus Carsonella ruddii]
MINSIKKIKTKIKNTKNIYNLLLKIGISDNFLKNSYLINNCIVKTWIKIIIKKKILFFGYSNSLLISGLVKIIFKVLNNNKKNNIFIFFKFDFLKIIKIKNSITNLKKNSFKNIILYIQNYIK